MSFFSFLFEGLFGEGSVWSSSIWFGIALIIMVILLSLIKIVKDKFNSKDDFTLNVKSEVGGKKK